MYHRSGIAMAVVLAAVLLTGPAPCAFAAGNGGSQNFTVEHSGGLKAADGLVDRVQQQGDVPVIVRLRGQGQSSGILAGPSGQRSRMIADLQADVLDAVRSTSSRSAADLQALRFRVVPALALRVGPQELAALLEHPSVVDVVEDTVVRPLLDESVPLIGGGSDGSFLGYTGAGQTVAILDTGVDKNHPFLSGKVVSEACYSHNIPSSGITSLCPGGAIASTAEDSGLHCDASISMCEHGTIVAGIAAGSNDTFSGVAKDAGIIAVQVFSRYSSGCGSLPAPCALAYTSDVLRGLERVYELRNTYNIAAVNLSLGGGMFDAPCDEDSSYTEIIELLHAAGIATVTASGNGGYTNALCAPACVSSSVSVGSSTKSDTVSGSSNSAYFLSLLAPGSSITTSAPGGVYGTGSGTSLAAPHVAGAWAVMKQAYPEAGVDSILELLRLTGKPVADTREGAGGRVVPRIDIEGALVAVAACGGDEDCGGTRPYCVEEACVECVDDGDCDGFCVDNVCVECLGDADCDDAMFCNGDETCSGGACVLGADPCFGGAPYCIEAGDRCVECTLDTHCGPGYDCAANVCEEDCELKIKYKPLSAEKLVGKKKGKKMKLKITGGEGFDPYGDISVGPFDILKTKPKVKYKKGVLKKNELQVIVYVPPDTPAGTYGVHTTPCSGTVDIL